MIAQTLLGLLAAEPTYGYQLKQAHDRLFVGFPPLSFGQVYSTLGRLSRDDRVVVQAIAQDGGPERKMYQITRSGREELASWLTRPEEPVAEFRPRLFAKVVTALLVDQEPTEMLDMQRQKHLAAMRELTSRRRSGDLKQLLRADYALFHLEADLRWMDLTSARIEALRVEITSGR